MAPRPADFAPAPPGGLQGQGITALLGPTNTGKTHQAVERMLQHRSGMIGLPLRLLAREVYDRITRTQGEAAVALVTGEEKRVPERPRYWVCTIESMPTDLEVDFVAIDEVQLAEHRQRGHTFTDRMLHLRGSHETWLLGADTMRGMVADLVPTARVEQHPRFSSLAYTGVHSLASLPPRTAVVAFSADDVYALAERLRARHGGTAVVLGALSPRARNAQVALYQSGEVKHMVATDAIGMGLNMDVDRVVFASLRKFDGREARDLELSEMAQIAGRAGRYTTNGGFGLLRPQRPMAGRVVSAIEGHRFDPVRRVVWRNSNLNFESVETLIASLRERPRHPALRLVEQADDYDALMRLVRDPELRRSASSPELVALLWDVCRIPDFRKLMLDSHVELLAAIFAQLSGPTQRVDEDWMAKRIARLDDQSGDIQAMMRQIAFIRTWTYVCNHPAWIVDPEHWQQRARDIEDRCSDALHERLTARFVDHSAAGHTASARSRRRPRKRPVADERPRVEGGPFATLAALEDALPQAEGNRRSEDRWIDDAVDAPFDAFSLHANGELHYADAVVATLRRGADMLHPEVLVAPDDVGAGARSRLLRRSQAWVRDAVARLTAPLESLAGDLQPAARGLAYQLLHGLGIVPASAAKTQLGRLTAESRAALRSAGVTFGQHVVVVPELFDASRPEIGVWRAALWSAHAGWPRNAVLPAAGAASLRAAPDVDPGFYFCLGFPVVGGIAVHFAALERAAHQLASLGRGPWRLPERLGAQLGVDDDGMRAIVAALGYAAGPQGWSAPPRTRRRRRARRR